MMKLAQGATADIMNEAYNRLENIMRKEENYRVRDLCNLPACRGTHGAKNAKHPFVLP